MAANKNAAPGKMPPTEPETAELPPTEPETAELPPTEPENVALVEGRVLSATAGHAVDAVIELPAAEAEAAEKAGWLDTHPDAVAFAKSLPA